MKILLLASSYPHAAGPFSGLFSERSAIVLGRLCEEVAVLAPRPFVPPMLEALVPRWKAYASIPFCETRHGIPVRRPGYPQLPRLAGVFSFELGGYFFGRRAAREMHRRSRFDVVLALDLVAGGLAWRLGDDLGIPACGWVSGDYFGVPPGSIDGRALRHTLDRLAVVFYQSRELMEKAAGLLQVAADRMPRDRHVVLPRGIPRPPALGRGEVRKRVRAEWGVGDDRVLVLSVGRITREKGIYEIVDAIAAAAARNPRVTGAIVGSLPAFDETAAVDNFLNRAPQLRRHVRLVPACAPDQVWEYLCAADIFAFASHTEGMPNSLLEAMAMGVPSVACSIPPVQELDAGLGALLTVPGGDASSLADAILHLAASPHERTILGERGQARVMDGFMIERNMQEAVRRIGDMLERRGSLCSSSRL